jgi:hypothetical protein
MKMKTYPQRVVWLGLALLTLLAPGALAWAAPATTPRAGNAERKAVMDALRKPVTKVTKFRVVFKVGHLKVKDGWAFLNGSAVKPDGKALGDQFLWGEISALLRKQGKNWTVLHWGFATDTGVMDEARRKWKQAPREIFPM